MSQWGGRVSGNLEIGGDNDWFAVQLEAGGVYKFNLNADNNSFDTILSLHNSLGSQVAVNDDAPDGSMNSEITTYTAPTTGTYYLGARAYWGDVTGTYVVSTTLVAAPPPPPPADDFAATTATTGRITVGGTATGLIGAAGDNDWFAVSLSAGQRYTFNLDPASSGTALANPFLSLYDSTGALVVSDDDSGPGLGSEISYTASTAGTYYLGARGVGSGTGNYQLSAAAAPTTAAGSGFNISVGFTGDAKYLPYFQQAAHRWETVITQDLPDVRLSNGTVIDDLLINASVVAIDGIGGVLGRAGPTGTRSAAAHYLPYSGMMQFDAADVDRMVANGSFVGVVTHEMGHVLGFSNYFFAVDGLLSTNDNTQYTGSAALAAYRQISASASNASYVPLETGGGSGTRLSHWSEAVFSSELMTGWASGNLPLSVVTIGALSDMGYGVNMAAADPFTMA